MEFIHEKERIYAEDGNGKLIAEILFPARNGVATITHTFTDDSLRGQGIAGKLVQAACESIRADGNRIAATCSYAVVWLQKHPEYQSVENNDPLSCSIYGKH